MIRLGKSLAAWGTTDFDAVVKHEIEQLGSGLLPLQQGLATGSYVIDRPLTVMINGIVDETDIIRVRAGIFFKGLLSGCSCADDPTPVAEENEYCEVELEIDKTTGDTTVRPA